MTKRILIMAIAIVSIATGFAYSQQVVTKQATAFQIFSDFLESVGKGDAKVSASYFDMNGYIEAPYVTSLGFPTKTEGQASIEAALKMVKQAAPNFQFKNIKAIMETPNEVVAEYEVETTMANSRAYKQQYIAHVVVKDGKIVSHREFLNTVAFAEAFLPNGLKDLVK
jgi:ketosteroid isomerase-like protein